MTGRGEVERETAEPAAALEHGPSGCRIGSAAGSLPYLPRTLWVSGPTALNQGMQGLLLLPLLELTSAQDVQKDCIPRGTASGDS